METVQAPNIEPGKGRLVYDKERRTIVAQPDDREYCYLCDGEGEIENGDPDYTELVPCPACGGSGFAPHVAGVHP